jgi:DNA repair protein RecN (Recombination protein N)
LNTAQSLQAVYSAAQPVCERLDSSYQDLKDLSMEVSHLYEKLELDPERLQWVNDRLDLLYSLQQKHKVSTVDELIVLRDQLSGKLQAVYHYDEQLAVLQQELGTVSIQLQQLAEELTSSRKQAAQQLERALVEKVSSLGMPHMQFKVEFLEKEQVDASGADVVRFLFSANKNIPMKPVSETASGGEISRLMLGIKALIASSIALPTIIFDEIDTGISGEVADKMGNIMQGLGQVMQVLAITHLPQIAAKGKTHYFVYKDDTKHRTETHIKILSPEERVNEIAQMLSGSELTEAAKENAKILLKR